MAPLEVLALLEVPLYTLTQSVIHAIQSPSNLAIILTSSASEQNAGLGNRTHMLTVCNQATDLAARLLILVWPAELASYVTLCLPFIMFFLSICPHS